LTNLPRRRLHRFTDCGADRWPAGAHLSRVRPHCITGACGIDCHGIGTPPPYRILTTAAALPRARGLGEARSRGLSPPRRRPGLT